jgi:heptosyltransferase II
MDYRSILVRATNWVGDAVMCVPALQALRRRYPAARITILAKPWVAGLYQRESFCDELIPYEVGGGIIGFRQKLALANALRARNFDCALLLPNSFDSAVDTWLARIPVRIGYARDGRSPLLTKAIKQPQPGEIPKHQRFYYLNLLKQVGLIDNAEDSEQILLEGRSAAALDGRARFHAMDIATPVIGVSPGAAYGNAKRWLPERFAEAAASIAADRNARIAVFGSKEEREIGEKVRELVQVAGYQCVNFAGTTSLAEFIELAAACEVFLTNDSGPMHIASALGVPTVAVFGATDHVATGPTGASSRIVREPVDCSPCMLRECPIDHRCMTAVSAERVKDTALSLLAERPIGVESSNR